MIIYIIISSSSNSSSSSGFLYYQFIIVVSIITIVLSLAYLATEVEVAKAEPQNVRDKLVRILFEPKPKNIQAESL